MKQRSGLQAMWKYDHHSPGHHAAFLKFESSWMEVYRQFIEKGQQMGHEHMKDVQLLS